MTSLGPVRVGVVVPAAGRSRRMGRSKPLLELGGSDFIGVILETCRRVAAGVSPARRVGDGGEDAALDPGRSVSLGPVAVVYRARDAPLAHRLSDLRASLGELTLLPVPLRHEDGDMLWSVRQGAQALAARRAADGALDWVLVWPVDGPLSQTGTVRAVVSEAARASAAMVVPAVGAATGHPVAVPAGLLLEAHGPEQEAARRSPGGLGALVDAAGLSVRKVATSDRGCLLNANTPEAYERVLAEWTRAGRRLRAGQDAIG